MYTHAYILNMCPYICTHIQTIHVPEPPLYPPKLHLCLLPRAEKTLEGVFYTHCPCFLTSYFANRLPSPPLHWNCLSQGFFVNLFASFSEPFSVLTGSSQSILKMSFSWHVIQRYSSDLPPWLLYLNLSFTSTITLCWDLLQPYCPSSHLTFNVFLP